MLLRFNRKDAKGGTQRTQSLNCFAPFAGNLASLRLRNYWVNFFILLFILLGISKTTFAQIPDSISQTPSPASVQARFRDSLMRQADSLFIPPFASRDTTPEKGIKPWAEKQIGFIKDQMPTINKGKDKTTLTLKFFWREDITIPYPKGLLKVGAPPPYDPAVAWQRSAMIPGWGQVYNRSAWKIPIFYAGYGAAIWWISYNNQQYRRFGNAYFWTIDGDSTTSDPELLQIFDDQRLREKRNEFRQRRDQAVLILLGWHAVQVAEAYIDAHLRGFDVSEDLSFKLSPDLLKTSTSFGSMAVKPGLSLTFTF